MNRFIHDYISDIKKEFSGYNLPKLRKDILAGITVAAVALPLALAFGVGSGADAASGLITAVLSAFVIGALSGASFQISGPTGAMTAILVPLAAKHGLTGAFSAAIIAGMLLIIAGLTRIGRLVYFLPSAIISGFTSGIAVIIALGQIDNFFGVTSHGESALERIIYLFQHTPVPNLHSVGTGLFVIALMLLWPRKWGVRVPASLVGIISSTLIVSLLHLPVNVVGAIPATMIHEIRFSPADLLNIPYDTILLPAISIAALCMVESLLCGTVAGRMKNESMNADRELIAQGIGNLILPFFGGVPATAAIARTSVAIKSGSQTRLTGIIHGIILLISMFFLSSYMSNIPMPALAGVLIITAWRMNEWHSIRYIFGHKFKGAIAKFLVTMIATVLFDLTVAIAIGLFLSIILFVIKMSDLDVTVSELDASRIGAEIEANDHVQVIYLTGAMFFGSLGQLQSELSRANGKILIFSMRGVPIIDTSALSMLSEFCADKKDKGTSVLFSCVQPKVKTMFDRSGITAFAGEDSFFENARDAILSVSLKI